MGQTQRGIGSRIKRLEYFGFSEQSFYTVASIMVQGLAKKL